MTADEERVDTHVRLTPAQADKLRRLAQQQDRSQASVIRGLIDQAGENER